MMPPWRSYPCLCESWLLTAQPTQVISHSSPSVTHSGKVNASSTSVCAYMLRHSCTSICVHAHTPHFLLSPKCSFLPLADPQIAGAPSPQWSPRSSQSVIPSLLVPWDGSLPQPEACSLRVSNGSSVKWGNSLCRRDHSEKKLEP